MDNLVLDNLVLENLVLENLVLDNLFLVFLFGVLVPPNVCFNTPDDLGLCMGEPGGSFPLHPMKIMHTFP